MEVKMFNVTSVKEVISHHKLGDEKFITRQIRVIDEDGLVLHFTIFSNEESKVLTSSIEVKHHDD